jgi:hypothetical protein
VISLATEVTTFQVTSATGSAIVHNDGQEVQVVHTVTAGATPTSCSSDNPDLTCRIVSTGAGTVTVGYRASTHAMHGTTVAKFNNGAARAHVEVTDFFG